ncbi:DUF4358 domain-containing protein [Paenibacillus sp. P96]|uniref:DUF4358 domain-containing protein n=1 Tax=Paenibacillus zeirhizosphaerae TaxID=2987519 RepID=A0ABT9FSH4_9BACL|nr:DUF4358 domain-containing protein [Paenibacillus sp. P96]MDP4097687.1 DUF4358 domain-containing protein [Paenibacillus sp. P96]
MEKRGINKRGILSFFLIMVVVLGVLSGCSGRGSEATEKLSVVAVGKRIEQTADLKEMKKGDLKKLQKLYRLDADIVEDFILYTSVSNVKADEWVVIKVKEQSQTEIVEEKIEERIAAQKIKFESYRPNEYFLVENHVLKTKGRFVFFVVSDEAGQMEDAFDDTFKQIE